MSTSAQRDEANGPESLLVHAATGTDGAVALRQLAAERLAAHRSRRAGVRPPAPTAAPEMATEVHSGPAVHPGVRDAVAARYRKSPSYQEFLAAEAERALQKAQAEAEVAARNAAAMAEAQRKLLDDIDEWNQPPAPLFVVETHQEPPAETQPAQPAWHEPSRHEPARPARRHHHQATHIEPLPAEPLKIQLYSELPAVSGQGAPHTRTAAPYDPEELHELDQEIAFRVAPEFEEHRIEPQPIQANIIEFPRQLVATRKARPRLAEGPLREDGTPEPQLRIFEVEPEQVSIEPTFEPEIAPAWQSIVLEPAAVDLAAQAAVQQALDAEHNLSAQLAPTIYAAPVARRVMAMAVDAVCVGAGVVAFAALAAKLCGPSLREVPLPVLGGVVALAVPVFAVLYQMLFFCFNEATPGMVYARLGLCTFAETNPSRSEVRRRLWATAMAVAPLGLGLLWMALDSDRLGWHDRISRMYPRAY
jgi:uncharacterized RDD family membrane protein YckC